MPRLPARTADATAPRRQLTRETILRTAIAIADAEGIETLTMRRLAGELGVVPTAIYWHVRSREELLREMIALATTELLVPQPSADTDWTELVRDVCRSLRTLLLQHRWILPLAPQYPGVGVTNFVEAMLQIGRTAGFDSVASVTMARLVGTHAVGSVIFAGREADAELADMPELTARDRLTFAAEYVRLDTAAVFEQGLDYLIDGLRRSTKGKGKGKKEHRMPPASS